MLRPGAQGMSNRASELGNQNARQCLMLRDILRVFQLWTLDLAVGYWIFGQQHLFGCALIMQNDANVLTVFSLQPINLRPMGR